MSQGEGLVGGSERGDTLGLALQSQPARVSIGRRESFSKAQAQDGKQALGDGLEDTKNFYGLTAPPPPLPGSSTPNPKLNRTPSRRNHNRSNSKVSSSSRPLSPYSGHASATSGRYRTSVPIPTPKGFFSPKKPPGAIAAEQREEARAKATATAKAEATLAQQASAYDKEAGPSAAAPGTGMSGFHSAESALAVNIPDLPPPSSMTTRHPPLSKGSLTDDLPSPPHTYRDLEPDFSSDNLVRASGTYTSISTTIATSTPPPLKSETRRSSSNKKPKSTLPLHQARARPRASSSQPRRYRRYTKFQNPLSTFFCGGRYMTGGSDWYSALFSLTILLGMTGVWTGTTGWWFWAHGTEYGLAKGGGVAIMAIFIYLFGLTLSSFVTAAFRDPGIIPRGLDLNPLRMRTEDSSYDVPLDKTFSVGNKKVTVRWCETCSTYRPPRSSHCRVCGNCVDGIDHHCAYIHTCVGKGNYLPFLTLLITAVIASIYIVVFSAIHFLLICRHEHVSFARAIRESPGAAVSFLLGVLIQPALLFLLGYHIRLMIFNLTTVEAIRESASKNLLQATKRPTNNPFSADSLRRNVLLTSLARPQFPSWINAKRWEVKDERRVNPGLLAQAGYAPGWRATPTPI